MSHVDSARGFNSPLVVLVIAGTMVVLAMASTVGSNPIWYHGCIEVR